MNKISVVLIVRNEEKKIRECLKRLAWADEIYVIDQSSEDRTLEVAKEYTGKLRRVPAYGVCEAHRMASIADCAHEWVLFLDADEWVTPELAREIRFVLENPQGYTSFYLGRKNYFLGKWIRGGGWYPAYSIKLFKKGFAFFSTVVHQDGVAIGGKTGHLKHKTLHFTYSSLGQFFEKLDRYTTHSAQEAYKKGLRITPRNCAYQFILKPGLFFFRKFMLWFGFIDGYRGLIIAYSSAATLFVHAAKIWELQGAQEGALIKEQGQRVCIRISDHIARANVRTSLDAKGLVNKGLRINYFNSMFYFILKPAAIFCYGYFIKRGFLDGVAGLITCTLSMIAYFFTVAKAWEIQNNTELERA